MPKRPVNFLKEEFTELIFQLTGIHIQYINNYNINRLIYYNHIDVKYINDIKKKKCFNFINQILYILIIN